MNATQMVISKLVKFSILCAVIAGTFSDNTVHAETVNFDDLGLAADSYENGSGLSTGYFTSAGAEFFNNYSPSLGWVGWSYSSKHDLSTAGVLNQYSAYSASENGSNTYAVAFAFNPVHSKVQLPFGQEPVSVDIANTTYAALSMLQGDAFSRPFADGDYFKLAIRGENASGLVLDETIITLAEFTASQEYLLEDWQNVDLSSMQGLGVTQLSFELFSTDSGPWGINTPAYFALDNLELQSTFVTPIPGDANYDNMVDQQDLQILLSHYGSNFGPVSSEIYWDRGDFDFDGKVSLSDLLILKKNYGTDSSSSDISPSAVPEPIGMVLLFLGVLFSALLTARRRKSIA